MTAPRNQDRPAGRLRFLTSARTRAMASLLAVAALAGGMSVQGTFAFFTDTATLQTGSFTSGTLDLTLDGALPGQGGTTTKGTLNLADMVPGESVAQVVTVRSAGSVGLTYTSVVTSTAGLSGQLIVSVFAGGTASNAPAGGLRTGTCSSTTAVGTATTALSTGSTPLTPARGLNGTTSEDLCVKVLFNPAADSTYQSKLAQQVTIDFTAKQVGA